MTTAPAPWHTGSCAGAGSQERIPQSLLPSCIMFLAHCSWQAGNSPEIALWRAHLLYGSTYMIETTEQVSRADTRPRPGWRRWPRVIIPGLIYGAGDDDPAAIGAYAQTGAQSGTSLLWLMLLSTPMLITVQLTCAKLGVVCKAGLSSVLRERYGLRVAILAAALIGVANVATMGADLAGTAAGAQLLLPGDISWKLLVLPIAVAIWYVQVYRSFAFIRGLFTLLASVLTTYILAGLLARPDWALVLRNTFIPDIRLNTAFFTAAVGLLGATISPYMFYFQAAEEVEEGERVTDLQDVKIHTTVGMVFSNLISYFVILATATTLFAHAGGRGVEIDTAAQAADALRPLAGSTARLLFALGLIGAGLLAVPVLAASTATMIAEIAGWQVGMDKTVRQAKGYYFVLSVSLAAGLLITLSGFNPMRALFWSQVLSGTVAPVLVLLIFRLAGRHGILGAEANSRAQQFWGWLTFLVMASSIGLMVYGWLDGRL